MRGIMIHSLMARGVPFDEANRVANTVRDRLRPRGVVDKPAILEVLHELLDPEPASKRSTASRSPRRSR